jgi:hypothetical protein
MNFPPSFRPDAAGLFHRRDLIKSAGAFSVGGLMAGACAATPGAAPSAAMGLPFPLVRGPYQNNGATPWYATLPIGTPGQPLKIALDTGSNFIWLTSTLCGSGCSHYGGLQFNYGASSSFSWVDQTDKSVSFGPWGTMIVETGRDLIGLPGGGASNTTMYLSKSYSGPQFQQLDWDGGIGFPSGSQYRQPGVSFFFTDLLNAGLIDPAWPYVSFGTNYATKSGAAYVGGYDPNAFDPYAGIFFPWTPYTALPGVEYIWTTPLKAYQVGGKTIAQNVFFSLDSGSSRFKGDDNIMNTTLQLIASLPTKPYINIFAGQTTLGGPGQMAFGPDDYMKTIEAGPDAGKTLPQFNPLGIPQLVLVGSVVMDLVYTIFVYDVSTPPGGYQVSPVGMWVFNKTGGPEIVKTRSDPPKELFRPRPLKKSR